MVRASIFLVAMAATLGPFAARPQKSLDAMMPIGSCPVPNGPTGAADSLDAWLERLVQIESRGISHLTVLDRKGRLSRGCLQFQDRTLLAQVRKYGFFPNVRDAELQNVAYDCREAKRLARAMLQDDPRNWRHGQISARKIGLPPDAPASPVAVLGRAAK